MARVGPYSTPNSLLKLDGRTREARLMRATIRDLVKHVGGRPSATQAALIERAAMLTLHLALMDARIAEHEGGPTERESRAYLAWSNSLTRILRQLGPAVASASPTDLRDFLKQRANP